MKCLALLPLLVAIMCCAEPIREESLGEEREETSLQLPEGFQATVVADELGSARHIAVRENGDVFVALRALKDGFGIVALRDNDGDGVADVIRRFGEYPGTGIAFRGDYLYFASDVAVYRYRLIGNELLPEPDPEKLVGGFLEQGQHAVKPFAFDQAGNLYVNVGAPSNACQEKQRTPGSAGLDPCPQLERQAGIWRFSADQAGQSQVGDGVHFAGGIRNAVAIAWNPSTDRLYALQHGRDQLHQLWPDLYTTQENAELPAEEFLLVEEGSNFGWPYCYYDHFQKQRVLAPEYGGDGVRIERCSEFGTPILAFPGHWAPNDLLFYTGDQFPGEYQNGAFIAFHGSWNRAPEEQRGYLVAFVPFNEGQPSDSWRPFAEGFPGTERIQSPRDATYRPTGLAQGPDGSLYISDSQKGRIWRVVFVGT